MLNFKYFFAHWAYIFINLKLCSPIQYDCSKLNNSISNETFYINYYLHYLTLRFKDFNYFDEIKINCSKPLLDIFIVELIPHNKLILDNSLNLRDLNLEFHNYNTFVYASNLNGIDLESKINLYRESIALELGYSNLNLYLNN